MAEIVAVFEGSNLKHASEALRHGLARAFRTAVSFGASSKGNIGLLTALMIVPIVGVSGYAVDHLMVSSKRSQLESAADAAALAAVKAALIAMQASVAGGPMPDYAGAARKAANAIFLGNSAGLVGNRSPTVTVTKQGLAFTVKVTWAANVRATFGPIFGKQSYAVNGVTSASASLAAYVKIYVMVDTSQSMGIGASANDQQRLFNLTGCALACHLTGEQSYTTARNQSPPIQTRIDVVRDALLSVTARAKAVAKVPNQVKIGVYTTSNDVSTLVDADIASQSTNFDDISTKLQQLKLGETGGGSDFHAAFSFLDQKVSMGGDGSSEMSPLVFVLFMSDGVEDSQIRNGLYGWGIDPTAAGKIVRPHSPMEPGQWPWASSVTVNGVKQVDAGQFGAMDPNICANVKAKGAFVFTLEIEYVIPIPAYAKKHDGMEDLRFAWIKSNLLTQRYSNGRMLSLIGRRMETCATTPGDFFQANSDAEISRAINAMFDRALGTPPRLTR